MVTDRRDEIADAIQPVIYAALRERDANRTNFGQSLMVARQLASDLIEAGFGGKGDLALRNGAMVSQFVDPETNEVVKSVAEGALIGPIPDGEYRVNYQTLHMVTIRDNRQVG